MQDDRDPVPFASNQMGFSVLSLIAAIEDIGLYIDRGAIVFQIADWTATQRVAAAAPACQLSLKLSGLLAGAGCTSLQNPKFIEIIKAIIV
jgi:hypothetical protein